MLLIGNELPSTIHHNTSTMTITPTFCYSHCPLFTDRYYCGIITVHRQVLLWQCNCSDRYYCGTVTVHWQVLLWHSNCSLGISEKERKCKLKIINLEYTRHCDKIPWNPGTVKPALHCWNQELSSLHYISEVQELSSLFYTAEDDLHIPFWARSLLTKHSQSLQSCHLPTYTCIWNEILQPQFCTCLHPIYLILLHQITFKNWDLKETLTIKFYISALCYPFHTQTLILTIHFLTDVKFLCTIHSATLVSYTYKHQL